MEIILFIIVILIIIIIYVPANEESFVSTNDNNIDMKKIKYYFFTMPQSSKRKDHMKEIFKEYDLTEINPQLNIARNQSGSSGFGRMIDQGLRDQKRNEPFKPFIILEDDCSFYRPMPDNLSIPSDADIIYIGLSAYSIDPKVGIFGKSYNEDYFRVYNMLATHGIMICSALGASVILKCAMESYHKNEAWDLPLLNIQPYYKIYGLKNPLVFQDAKYGGQETFTKVSYYNSWNRKYDRKYLNQINPSVVMVNNFECKDKINNSKNIKCLKKSSYN